MVLGYDEVAWEEDSDCEDGYEMPGYHQEEPIYDGPAEFDMIPINALEPPGWRWVNFDEAHDYKFEIDDCIPGRHEPVALEDGGHISPVSMGSQIFPTRGYEVGMKLIMIGGYDEPPVEVVHDVHVGGPPVVASSGMGEWLIVSLAELDAYLHDGWRWANTADCHQYPDMWQPMMSEWAIVGLENGKVDGPGYGLGIHEGGFGRECG